MLGSPGLLAAGAAGCAAAICTLWALRGLPFGTALLWLTPLPLFLAGLGFGAGSGLAASLLATLLVALSGGTVPVAVFLALFGLPVPLLLAAALRGGSGGGQMDLALPLALLGLWPLGVLGLAALATAGEGGLEAALRRLVEGALARMGLPAGEAVIAMLVRVEAAAVGFWTGLALLANGAAAQSFLARRGLARAATPDYAEAARLPRWYPAVPAAALALFLATGGGDVVALSALLLSLLPFFWLGLAGVHRRARGHGGRVPLLVLFYLLLVVFLQLLAPALVGLGLFDHVRRGQGAAPTQT